jgi:kynurenine formamidase
MLGPGNVKPSPHERRSVPRSGVTRFVELGHPLEEGVTVSARGAPSTSLDNSTKHGNEDRLSRVPLAAVAGVPGLVVDVPVPPRAVGLPISEQPLQDRAVLIRTGWDKHWGTDSYLQAVPYLAAGTIDMLVRNGPALVGVDFSTIDAPADPSRTARTRLLRAGVLVVENLCNLSALPTDGFRFFAVPLRMTGEVAIPVRAFAELLPR